MSQKLGGKMNKILEEENENYEIKAIHKDIVEQGMTHILEKK